MEERPERCVRTGARKEAEAHILFSACFASQSTVLPQVWETQALPIPGLPKAHIAHSLSESR